MLDYWRERAHDHGLPGLYFASMTQHGLTPPEIRQHFDAVMLFQPFVGYYGLPQPPPTRGQRALAKFRSKLGKRSDALVQRVVDKYTRPTIVDYDTVWREIVENPPKADLPLFQGSYVDWDNTARYRNRATIWTGSTPHRFEYWMKRLLERVAKENREEEQLVFVNAWNEWAEGAYLEPDERNGFGYLEALARAIRAHEHAAGVNGAHVSSKPTSSRM
jgi:hypothetical protein